MDGATAEDLLYASAHTRVTRVVPVDGPALIRKVGLGPDAAARAAHERAALERLAGVEGVLRLAAPDGEGLLTLDVGARPLDVTTPLAAGELVRLGAALAGTLADVHARRVTHGDVDPGNVVLAAGRPYLVDFDSARLGGENDPGIGASQCPAPEQTGRTAHTVDHRTDLYGLGATLYRLATGRPLFTDPDPLRLVQAQLSEVPPALATVAPAVPPALSAIVARLLEKEPDRRYQSAAGLRFDLERVRSGQTAAFPLGERDFPARLSVPRRLVGRDRELTRLGRGLLDVLGAGGGHEPASWWETPPPGHAVLVSGPPGVGKTRLVEEVRPVVTGRGGWFVSGRWDQRREDAGGGPLRRVWRGLGRQVLAQPEAGPAGLRERLRGALGDLAGALPALLPEVGPLPGTEPRPLAADPPTARVQLQKMAMTVLRTLADPGRPIVVFLDDLQWANPAELDFLDRLVVGTGLPGVLLIGAYRDTELGPGHPLSVAIDRWKRLGAAPEELGLADLDPAGLAALLAELLRAGPATAGRLAAALYPRTAGNPAETVELVNLLRDEEVLVLGPDGWEWTDAELAGRVERSGPGQSAVRIRTLPGRSRRVLHVLACLGGQVERELLELGTGRSGGGLDADLEPAIEAGLLLDEPELEEVRFAHGRAEQAALEDLAAAGSGRIRLALARRLARVPGQAVLAAAQYAPVLDRLDRADERREAAGLLRKAAVHARLQGNYSGSLCYLDAVERLVGPDVGLRGERHADLYRLGRLEEADRLYDWILSQDPPPLERVEAACAQMSSLTNRGRSNEALTLGLELLAALGVAVPAEGEQADAIKSGLEQVYAWMADGDAGTDAARPEVTDPFVRAVGQVCSRMVPAAYFTDHDLMAWLVLVCARLWIEHGPVAALVPSVSHLGLMLSERVGDYRLGRSAVWRVLTVSEAREYRTETARARFVYALGSAYWFDPSEFTLAQVRRAREELVRDGELQTASYTFHISAPQLLECAGHVDELVADLDAATEFCARTSNDDALSVLVGYRALAGRVRGAPAEAPVTWAAGRMAESPTTKAYCEAANSLAAAVMNDGPGLLEHTRKAMEVLPYIHGTVSTMSAHVLRACALAATDPGSAEARACRDWVAARAADSPRSFGHLLAFVEAELAAARGDRSAATGHFDAAIRGAGRQGRPLQLALITERAGRFHAACGWLHTALNLLDEARGHYAGWGATAKVGALEAEFPALPGRASPGPVVPADRIDLLGVLRCSQALSSETELAALGGRVTEVLGALTGATTVQVALRGDSDQDWFLMPVVPGAPPQPVEVAAAQGKLPLSAFRYAERSRRPLLVDDVAQDDRFAGDPYFGAVECRSLLVVPILDRETRHAMLVLGNSRGAGAFAAGRLDALKLITGQLAVSFENALVYAALERRVAERTADLEAANQRLEELSATDPLTGLANRRRLEEILDREWTRAGRAGTSLAVAMIDIDHFKEFNDRYGHPAGDECLRRVAGTLRGRMRGTDLLARYGGEEFAVVLPDTDLDGAYQLAERACVAVAELGMPHALANWGFVTISIGVAARVPADGQPAQALFDAADALLYKAKQRGRNRVIGENE